MHTAAIWPLLLVLAAAPVAAGAEGEDASTRATTYWQKAWRIERRIETTANDVSVAGSACVTASVLGGYGPACAAAAQQASDALDDLRDWREEAEDLASPDAEFHALWLRSIRCREDLIRMDRDQARATQIAAASRALEISERARAKQEECSPLRLEVFSRLLAGDAGGDAGK